MKLIYPFLLFPLIGLCSGQKNQISAGDSISYLIAEKEIVLSLGQSSFHVTTTISNSTGTNFILVAFKRAFVTPSKASVFTNASSKPGAGNAVIILDRHGARQRLAVADCDDCVEDDSISHRKDFLTIFKRSVRQNYLEATEVLRAESEKEVTLRIELNSVKLQKGEYEFYMIYYCDYKSIVEILSSKTIEDCQINYNATVLDGWIRSNTVKLIVQ